VADPAASHVWSKNIVPVRPKLGGASVRLVVRRNLVTFFLAVDPKTGETEYMSARIVLPDGREFHIGYHPNIGVDGQRDGINFGPNGCWTDNIFTEAPEPASIWIEDRGPTEMFCSELFQELTGRYPYEIEANIKANADYRAFRSDKDD
jgi:hypothetical protein